MVVVATTLVSEARSKSVEGLTAPFPPFASDAKDGPPVSYVNRPRALRATRLPWWVTASVAAGKA